MSHEKELEWTIYRELVRINHKLDSLIAGISEIEEELDNEAVSATLELIPN